MTADQVISLFQFDHDPHPHAAPFNGPSLHWNCTPRLILAHREKTATHDVPMIAHSGQAGPVPLRCQYQAKVMNRLLMISRATVVTSAGRAWR